MKYTIADVAIRQEDHGRYSLNDMHKAAVEAGANPRSKSPDKFFRSPRTQELLAILDAESEFQLVGETTPNWGSLISPVLTIEGRDGGTYVCKELVIAYGQFVSAAFDLRVIRTFLGMLEEQDTKARIQGEKYWDSIRPHWASIKRLALLGSNNRAIANAVPFDDGSPRSIGSVRNCLKKMQIVGYMNPKDFLPLRYKPKTAKRLLQTKAIAIDWGVRQTDMFATEAGAA